MLIGILASCSGTDEESTQFGKSDFVGDWTAVGITTYVRISDDGTYRFGPDLRDTPGIDPDQFTFEQGNWDIADGVLSYVSNEFTVNCKKGDRGIYTVTPQENGDIQFELISDDCTIRRQPIVTFQPVQD